MHPEMIRAIAAQQVADRHAEARARLRVRLARQARKANRHSRAADPLTGVRIPDYNDGTYRHESQPAGRVPVSATGSGQAMHRDAA